MLANLRKIVQILAMRMDDAILEYLRSSQISDQGMLLEMLQRDGFELTLSTLSRRMKKLGVRKEKGVYTQVLPGRSMAEPLSIRRVDPCLLIVKTKVGSAQALAVALDSAGLPSLAGSVAGYDTIFVASIAPSRLTSLEMEVRTFLGKGF